MSLPNSKVNFPSKYNPFIERIKKRLFEVIDGEIEVKQIGLK